MAKRRKAPTKKERPVITIRLTAKQLVEGFGIRLDPARGISVIVPNVTDGPLTVCKDIDTCTVPANGNDNGDDEMRNVKIVRAVKGRPR